MTEVDTTTLSAVTTEQIWREFGAQLRRFVHRVEDGEHLVRWVCTG